MRIQLISSHQSLPLRHLILRPGQPLETAQFPDDDADTTFHVGALDGEKILCVASFVTESNSELLTGIGANPLNPVRLRGMATDSGHQRQGLGRKVIDYGIQELKNRNCDFLWCKARQLAFPFYERLGFNYFGELFDIPGVALHKVMYKEL